MNSKFALLILLSYFVSSCSQNKLENKEALEIIEISNAFQKRVPINISDISKDCSYIALETTNESLIGNNYKIYSDDQYFVVINKKRISLFDRLSGKFIRTIGNSGNGPNEYSNIYSKMPYNEEKRVFYADRNRDRYEYDINGKLLNTRKGPELVYDFVNIDEYTYAAFIDNYLGDEKNKMIIFNETDSIIRIFPNYQSFPFPNSINIIDVNSWFYKLNSQLYFCERFSDTLFNVTPDSLIPRFVFHKGAYSFPYELRGDINNVYHKYFFTENIIESLRYIFYAFSYNKMIYTAVHDKKQKNTHVNEHIGGSYRGYINNINDFVPLELSSINGKGEMTCTIDAFKIKQWFQTNSAKFEILPDNIKKLKSVNESDNPVVVIARLKE